MSMVVLIFSYHSDQISNKYYMRTYTYTRYYYVFVMYTFLWDLTESYYLYKCFTSDTENCRSVSDQTYKYQYYPFRTATSVFYNVYIMTLVKMAITSVFKVSTYITTGITVRPIGLWNKISDNVCLDLHNKK
jgi:hypothetical protein